MILVEGKFSQQESIHAAQVSQMQIVVRDSCVCVSPCLYLLLLETFLGPHPSQLTPEAWTIMFCLSTVILCNFTLAFSPCI